IELVGEVVVGAFGGGRRDFRQAAFLVIEIDAEVLGLQHLPFKWLVLYLVFPEVELRLRAAEADQQRGDEKHESLFEHPLFGRSDGLQIAFGKLHRLQFAELPEERTRALLDVFAQNVVKDDRSQHNKRLDDQLVQIFVGFGEQFVIGRGFAEQYLGQERQAALLVELDQDRQDSGAVGDIFEEVIFGVGVVRRRADLPQRVQGLEADLADRVLQQTGNRPRAFGA